MEGPCNSLSVSSLLTPAEFVDPAVHAQKKALICVGWTLTEPAVYPRLLPPSTIQQLQTSLSLVVKTARQELSLSQPRRQLQGSTVLPSGEDQGWVSLALKPYSSATAGLQAA